MPFDPAPITKTKFQEFADAMLRGCAITEPHNGECFDWTGKRACALGAIWVGESRSPFDEGETVNTVVYERYRDLLEAYCDRYGVDIYEDNDSYEFTREEIAARIAAL